ncbi:hypothetical protein CRV24_004159 [Beauveria bassiana]|nr:hypothetical protein CRV24_004159 [Beauveria bassiana]
MIEFDPDRVPPIKLGLHIAQIVLAFVLWVLEIVVFTGKGSKVVGNNGWTFAALSRNDLTDRRGQQFFISIPIWLFLIMTPRFERTRRFANVHAMFAVDIFGIILWLSAFATQAAYNSSGLCGNRCGISKGVVAIGVIITLLFGGSTFISGYTMTYYKFHGSLPGYSNRKIRGGSNDIDPDKEAFSMAPHGDEAYERVHMDDHDHDGPSAGAGSYSNRYGADPNPYSGGHYEEEDPNRYGAVPHAAMLAPSSTARPSITLAVVPAPRLRWCPPPPLTAHLLWRTCRSTFPRPTMIVLIGNRMHAVLGRVAC